MTDEDRAAMEELAVEMSWHEAFWFLRANCGCGLREGHDYIGNLAHRFPNSKLATTWRQRCQDIGEKP